MGKIGLFGGTFDPIHFGHIALARHVLDTCSLDKIIFIPAGIPPHKIENVVTEKKHRFSMVQAAIAKDAQFCISDYELQNEEPNYSYRTIAHFKKLYPEDTVFFIVGGDSFRDFPKWKNYETLISLCTFIVVSRPEILPEQYKSVYQGLKKPPKVCYINDFSYGISSTEIRNRVAEGKDISSLVPPFVEQYIKNHNLYI